MSAFTAINLSRLPAPEVIEQVEFETLLEQMKAEAIAAEPELETALSLESEPATKVLRVCAYYRMLDRMWFNDGAKACMLALSTGTNLDQLAAFWGVERLVVQEADADATPPVPQIMESDEAFRARVQLSLEGHSSAGPRGAYIFWALSASGKVRDASVASPAPGDVIVTVLSHDSDGTPDAETLQAVEQKLTADDVRPLTDHVTVQPAEIVPYEITATLTLYEGPDPDIVLDAARAATAQYIVNHHRLGYDITLSGLYAALHQPGVQRVDLLAPAADIVVAPHQAAHCGAAPTLTMGGRDV